MLLHYVRDCTVIRGTALRPRASAEPGICCMVNRRMIWVTPVGRMGSRLAAGQYRLDTLDHAMGVAVY